jgi:hypothetical protein
VRKSLRWWFDAQFPKLSPQDWLAFARRTCREHSGGLDELNVKSIEVEEAQ